MAVFETSRAANGQSPNFVVPWLEMLQAVSAFCDELDINVGMWYPAFFPEYDSADGLARAEAHWTQAPPPLQL